MRRILCLVGTRPEAIKLAPVVLALRAQPDVAVSVLGTGQHRELSRQVLADFGLAMDADLDVMTADQSLAMLSSEIFRRLDTWLEHEPHDMLLVQGDTTSVLVGALTGFYRGIAIGHVEAGLRTHDMHRPFPEELNRVVTSLVADIHFAPTAGARDNLLAQGIAPAAVHVTGNTVIDALHLMAARRPEPSVAVDPNRPMLLVTMHRRENIGAPIAAVCRAIRRLIAAHADLQVVLSVHPNPRVREPVLAALSGVPQIVLLPPQGYPGAVALMLRARLILTDSGGMQEEGPALGKPVLVLRTETERPEAVAAGTVRLVGTDENQIFNEVSRLLDDPVAYTAMARSISPYGDGQAATRIAHLCAQFLAAREEATRL